MSLFGKRVLPLTLLGAAAVVGGCVGEASLDGDDDQETRPEAAEAVDPEAAEAADHESADSIDSDAAEAIDPEAAEAVGTVQQAAIVEESTWACSWGLISAGEVTIWWGNTTINAIWACNNWRWCGSMLGGCSVRRLR
ncbi:hypothetical protein [Sorangium sp. So ce887]|uniref:hypothetical protein n=1 Tax=Sorangium sp. So ce887 TaxID=3133324 RepID=UPI003F6205E4